MKTESFCHGLSNILLTNKIKVMGDSQQDEMYGEEYRKHCNGMKKEQLIWMICERGKSEEKLKAMLKSAKLTISRMKLSMLTHPDCVEGSEFDDYTEEAQELEDKIETHLKIT